MKRAVIVGSGITGMASALLLAKQGSFEEIIILEAAKSPAPLLAGFSRQGIHFDTGFHCAGGLGENGLLRKWLQALEVWEHIGDDNIYHLEEEFRFATQSKTYNFPAGKPELLPSIAKQFGHEHAKVFEKFFKEMQDILTISPYTDTACQGLPKLSFENSEKLIDKIKALSLPEILKQMLRARCLLYGLSPEQASFHDYSLVAGLYFDSCHGIYGGGQTIINAFTKAMQAYNIKICCNTKVSKIINDNRGFNSVCINDDEVLQANTCIFSANPKQLTHLVDKGVFRPIFHEHLNTLEESMPAFMVFAESNSDYLANRALYLLPKSANAHILTPLGDKTPTTYVIGSKRKNQTKNISLMAIFPLKEDIFANITKPRPTEYTKWKQEQTDFAKYYLETRLPELGEIKILAAATTATMRDWVHGSSGSLFGIAHTASSLPILPVTRMKGLFLAGQNILLPGILGGIISASLAAGFATSHESILRIFRHYNNTKT